MLPSPIAASTQAAGVVYVSPMLYVSRWLFIAQIKVLWMAMTTTIDSGDLVVCPVGQCQFLLTDGDQYSPDVVSKSVDQNCPSATKIEVVDVSEGLDVISDMTLFALSRCSAPLTQSGNRLLNFAAYP